MISSVLPIAVYLKQTFPNFMQLVHSRAVAQNANFY